MSRSVALTLLRHAAGAARFAVDLVESAARILTSSPRPEAVAVVTFRVSGGSRKKKGESMATTIKETDAGIIYEVELRSERGSIVGPDGVESFAWETSDPSLALLQTPWGGNPFAACLQPTLAGHVQVRFRTDADLGPGVREILLVDEVDILAGEAVVGQLKSRPFIPEPEPTPGT